ncbi:MAG: carboxymuconolactone decarboxylase family protein [Rhizobacter sp.]|nr:carboxymuconolactone decarboxylase family protein [Rhizobacter sp.]
MPRLPFITDDDAGPPELVAAIKARRGGQLAELDRLLLHSTPFATGWGLMMGRVRGELALSPRLRELAMLGVAVLNRAEYEFHHHRQPFLDAGGTAEQLAALRALPAIDAECFDATERAALQLTVEMTRHVTVSDLSFVVARRALGSDTHLVELIGVIAAYNMVSRFLVALELTPD